ncbi:MAG TPA: virulence RhuM family protein [Kiloniellales bacterium]
MEHETVWLTQKQMAELFQKDVRTVSEHIGNIFEEAELQPDSVVRNVRTTAADGKQYETRHYSLDVIISVGYRVKSLRGTQFRIWATQRLREYIVKGFTMDDERLKAAGGGKYFEELLNRIRDIRSSERVFWRKVLDIYATSIDYDPSAGASTLFFQTVQNKMHWAIVGQTAAEIIHTRADADKPQMGLTSWAGDRPRKADVGIAKNYLNQDELRALNLIVAAYLDFAELQAVSRRPMTMADWIAKLDDFIRISDRKILAHAGTVSHDTARLKAEAELDRFRAAQDALPRPVDQHFAAAIDELKQIEDRAKKAKPGRKKKAGDK